MFSPHTLPREGSGGAEDAPLAPETSYLSGKCWSPARPGALVICCSDGRFQESVDDFLQNHLGIAYYDRLYAPGGPGALASSGFDLMRSEQFRRECTFLLTAHRIEEVILIFHGAVLDEGPSDAVCADYRRKLPGRTAEQIAAQQQADLKDLLWPVFGIRPDLRIHAFRAEVRADERVYFSNLKW